MIDRVEAKADDVKFFLFVDRERKAQLVIFNPRVRAEELRYNRELRRLHQRLSAYAIAQYLNEHGDATPLKGGRTQ